MSLYIQHSTLNIHKYGAIFYSAGWYDLNPPSTPFFVRAKPFSPWGKEYYRMLNVEC